MLNLDTHIFLHALSDALVPAEQEKLAAEPWSISAIVLWEIARLAQLDRIELNLESPRLLGALERVHIWPVDLDVCREIARLDFRSDPADEIIAATSIVHAVPLVTRDRTIRKSKRVPLA